MTPKKSSRVPGWMTVRLALALLPLLAPGALVADDPTPPDVDLIVRAPADEIDGIAARQGLTVIDEVDAPPAVSGRNTYLLRAPSNFDGDLIVADIDSLEPTAEGAEKVILAAIPEMGGQAIVNSADPAFNDILNSIQQAVRVRPPSGTIDSDWLGSPSKRDLAGAQTRTLEIEFDLTASSDPTLYSLTVDLQPGAPATSGDCDAVGQRQLEIGGSSVKWQITNASDSTLTLDGLTLDWPLVNVGLVEIKLGGHQVFDPLLPEVAPKVVSAGWSGSTQDREIDPGKTEELELEFAATAGADPTGYALTADFSEGASTTFELASGACSTAVHAGLEVDGSKVRWQVTNSDSAVRSLTSLTLGWPDVNGEINKIKLGGDEIFQKGALTAEHGLDADGSKRNVWVAYVDQPAASILRVDEANRDHRGDAIVAIIDTGVDPDHELLKGQLLPGYDFLQDVAGTASEMADIDQSTMVILDQSTMVILDEDQVVPLNQSTMVILDDDQSATLDPNSLPPAFGHGTMVAGIIHRVAPEAQLMPLRAFDASGHGNLFDIVEAIYYAVDNGANVINMSFSLGSFSPALMRAVNYAARRGVTCVASAGNAGEETIVYPAAFGNTIGVTSSEFDDSLSDFANFGGDLVTVAAPGSNILTSYPGDTWAVASGTSFAAPWVAGAAALFADKNSHKGKPGRADYYVTSEALASAQPVQGDASGLAGLGRADLKAAMDKLRNRLYVDSASGLYNIDITFAEGCTASYPPASGGGGCAVTSASQLLFNDNDNKVEWDLTNDGASLATIDSITLTWPTANGDLRKIRMGGPLFEEARSAPTTGIGPYADVANSDAPDWEGDLEDRQIEPGETRRLRFEFELDAARPAN